MERYSAGTERALWTGSCDSVPRSRATAPSKVQVTDSQECLPAALLKFCLMRGAYDFLTLPETGRILICVPKQNIPRKCFQDKSETDLLK